MWVAGGGVELWRGPLGAAIALVALVLISAPAPATGGASAGGRDTLVPVGAGSSGFGQFTEGGGANGDAGELRDVLGAPDRAQRSQRFLCTMRWRATGVVARLAVFGSETGNPCRKGIFIEARLTGRRWHTKSGIRPGGRAAAARRESLRRCRRDTCGVKGFALELHRTDCAAARVPGVIAQTSRGRVRALIVRWRGCE